MPILRCARGQAAVVLVTAVVSCTGSPPGHFEVTWPGPNAADRAPVALHGLAAPELAEAAETGAPFSVFVDGYAAQDLPPVLGSYHVESEALLFRPRFPWKPGLAYRAEVRADGVHPGFESVHEFPAAVLSPTTQVSAVYPSGEVLPENLLRLYVHFSAPMSRGGAYEHVHVLDPDGEELEQPFLEIRQELWDPETTRLTLLFDPGRIKRGLVPQLQLGSPLVANRTYTLVIDADWIDARGVPLAAPYERRFRTAAPDHTQPDADAWSLTTPAARTRDLLVLTFDETLDHALLQRVFTVRREDGSVVKGEISIHDNETRWSLRPEEPWEPGAYRLETAKLLEDIAGNNLDRPFEVALTAVKDEARPAQRHLRVFEIR